ncbi:MAG: 50S ribosomal protein L3 [Burkholderiales bacterium]|nr:50S ribosomal protein L3 [Burkholderiales bacterium]
MSMGLVGRKVGMTRIFTDDGDSVPVTVLDVSNNRVAQVKNVEADGYCAIQIVFGARRPSRVNKALAGHYAKAGVEAGSVVREFRVSADEAANLAPGAVIGPDVFKVGQHVDVVGTSIGKGFAGVIKRHHFGSNRASHGNSITTRAPGSIGQAQDPGRVFPGKKMPGHLGNVRRTAQNLRVVRIDAERKLLLVRGAVPGHAGGAITVAPSKKARG